MRAFSPDTLTQINIWTHTAKISASCLWIDTPHAYVRMSWNFLFLMGGSNFELKIHPADCQKFCEKKLYSISYIWKATKSGSAPIFWRFQLVSPLPNAYTYQWRQIFLKNSVLANQPTIYSDQSIARPIFSKLRVEKREQKQKNQECIQKSSEKGYFEK